jgi:hypothetical protein
MKTITFAEPKFPFTKSALGARVEVAQGAVSKSKTSALLPPGDAALGALEKSVGDLMLSEDGIGALRRQLAEALAARLPLEVAFELACHGFVAHVGGLAKGDAAAIASVGLVTKGVAHRGSQAAEPLVPVITLAEARPRSGEVVLAWKRIANAKGYVIQRSEASGSAGFVHAASSARARVTLQGMPPRTQVWFQVAALNGGGQGGFSQSVCIVAN